MRKANKYLSFLFLILLAQQSLAYSTPHVISNPTPSNPLLLPSQMPTEDLKFTAYLDTSYNYLLRKNEFISGVDDRFNDTTENGFTLQQAAFSLFKTPEQGFGGLLNIIGGTDAYKLASYGQNPYYGSQTLGVDFEQLDGQYAHGPFILLAGKYLSLAGYEYNASLDDTNFSRSILAGYAQPGTHVGLRGKYDANKNLTLFAGFNNGWDSVRNINHLETLELGLAYLYFPIFSLQVATYSGQEPYTPRTNQPTSTRNFIDIIAIFNVTPKLALVVNGDYGLQQKGNLPNNNYGQVIWEGIAGYLNYIVADKWRTSLRGEIYNDKNGYTTGVRQNWREITLTLSYLPLKNIELRAETRHDFSNVNSFLIGNNGGVANNQQSYAVEGLYGFNL